MNIQRRHAPMPHGSANADVRLFINGEFRKSSSGKIFENISPVDGKVLGQVHEATESDVDAAVVAAKAALAGPWGEMPVDERIILLNLVSDRIRTRFDDFLDAEVADTGKPVTLASHIDIPRGAANFKIFAEVVKSHATEFFHSSNGTGGDAINYALRAPKGVIGVICPWNLPLLLMTWKVGPALACGNTVVVKPSELTPTTATLLGEIMNEVGVPPGVYNVVHGFGPNSAGEFLTRHPLVDAITFTGETKTGEAIMAAAACGVRPVSFELGGKNPSIVFNDCDVDKAVEGVTRSAFANCGQVCLGTERIYVQRPLMNLFTERLARAAQALKPGRPGDPFTTIGPLISHEHRQKVLSYYEKAVKEGAKVVTGGGIPNVPAELSGGAWIEPTIWTGLKESSVVVQEEIFGPCCHITPFDTEQEAIGMANNTPYGLAACVWTTNLARAHRVSSKLNAGIVWVTSWFLRDLRTAFGGSKRSGIGREGGVHSLEFYTELKNVCIQL
jgi:aminomuconate-semialdehyde/2-hydroxymuconate-6-semialdehyde dehydrogenase